MAGINGFGGSANQVGTPSGVYLDGDGNIYVSEEDLGRIKKFPANSVSGTNGVVVTGGGGLSASGLFVDGGKNIYLF